jgi:hypothetical protein
MVEESEFGSGLIYPLSLFIAHKEKDNEFPSIWFACASDHLYEFHPEHIKDINLCFRACNFKEKVFDIREKSYWIDKSSESGVEDVNWAIREAIDIMFELDKLFGFNPIKATWE